MSYSNNLIAYVKHTRDEDQVWIRSFEVKFTPNNAENKATKPAEVDNLSFKPLYVVNNGVLSSCRYQSVRFSGLVVLGSTHVFTVCEMFHSKIGSLFHTAAKHVLHNYINYMFLVDDSESDGDGDTNISVSQTVRFANLMQELQQFFVCL